MHVHSGEEPIADTSQYTGHQHEWDVVSEPTHSNASENSSEHRAKYARQCIDATHCRTCVLNNLEKNGEIIISAHLASKEQEHGDAAAPDSSDFDHAPREHSTISDAVFLPAEDDQCAATTDQESDDGRTVPRIIYAAPDQCQDHHDRESSEECEAFEIQAMDEGLDLALPSPIVLLLRSVLLIWNVQECQTHK